MNQITGDSGIPVDSIGWDDALGSLELLARRLPPQDQRAARLVEAALQGTRRGEALTTRLLAFARQQELCPRPLDLSGFLASFRPMLGELLGPRITFHVDLPPDIWLPHVDPNQFELALLSLAANARDAMPNGGRLKLSAGNVTLGEANDVFIEATPRPAVGTGDYIVLRLSDDGSGMDEVALARAADPFFTTKGPAIASGLGLSMAHGFALQSGGSLRIDSVPGEGTTVELWLPRTPQAVSAPRAEPHATGSSPPAAPLRVLLVDDDPLVAANARAMLEELGHHDIRMAGSGEEAMRLLARDAPVDLLVADYMMPGMTGVQLAARVRERFPSLPILLASGFADLEGSLGTRWPRLRKPYSLNGLAEALAGVMLPARG